MTCASSSNSHTPPTYLDIESDNIVGVKPALRDVLKSAARLQAVVPDAVLVGGAAAAFHARHRDSFDHDHVIGDLTERFDTTLDNLEALGEWSLARAVPRRIILGSLGGIESGIRQMRRTRALEIIEVEIEGELLRVPTLEETLRIKAWLALSRNQTRDYLDIAALAARLGIAAAAVVLAHLDDYYSELNDRPDPLATQLVRQLGDPRPRDPRTTKELKHYKRLSPEWQSWEEVRNTCAALARAMVES